ncbi:Ubiquitin carboxyl-terminal hydrolase 45 [Boothiomyces macroporosus]|uniref:ubiquitinyl hydrolase 1 n=1 Tax=Boothiomyces macroporosus TaxID=261099 RepID=A0AAD5UF30_9FUNG|nr:Ubiquitin carboxyl-terminal hydrolase 45 [Boothiomyces macroporosus]
MKKLNTDRKETVNPKELFDILKTSWGVYGRYGQQDSHEMLRRLLDGIRNEQLGLDLNGSKKEPNVLDGNDNAFPPSSQDLPSNIEAEQKSEIPENSKESCGDELTSHSIEERKSTVVDQVFGGNLVEEGKFKNYMNSLGRQVKKNLFNQKKEVESVSVTQQMTTLSISTNAALPREKVELIRKILKTDPILINSNPTISQCVAKFFDIEVLENDNGFVCENCAKDKREETMSDITISRTPSDMSMDSCGAVVEAESQVQEKDSVSVETVYTRAFKRYMLYTPPRVLVLHMKRFSQKGNKVSKVNNHVTFEEEIDISEFVAPPLPSDQKNGRQLQSCNYRLYAVIVHSGTMNGGHYVAYIRKQSASGEKVSWQYCSDSLVRFTNWDEVARCKPYMLFYENYNKV